MEKRVIVDYRMPDDMLVKLNEMGFKAIKSFKNKNVYDEISGHVDISAFYDGENLIVSKEAGEYYEKTLDGENISLIISEIGLNKKYPENICFNVCYTGKYAIGNFLYTSEDVVKSLRKLNAEMIQVNQGYANCSICVVDENSVITSDQGVFKVLTENGLDVLKIQEGYIDLFEMDYGFIGGASGLIGNDTICFFGDIDTHPDSSSIKAFLKKHNKEIVCLNSSSLKDYGSLICF